MGFCVSRGAFECISPGAFGCISQGASSVPHGGVQKLLAQLSGLGFEITQLQACLQVPGFKRGKAIMGNTHNEATRSRRVHHTLSRVRHTSRCVRHMITSSADPKRRILKCSTLSLQVPGLKKGKAIMGKTHKSSGMIGLVQRRLMEVPSPAQAMF